MEFAGSSRFGSTTRVSCVLLNYICSAYCSTTFGVKFSSICGSICIFRQHICHAQLCVCCVHVRTCSCVRTCVCMRVSRSRSSLFFVSVSRPHAYFIFRLCVKKGGGSREKTYGITSTRDAVNAYRLSLYHASCKVIKRV